MIFEFLAVVFIILLVIFFIALVSEASPNETVIELDVKHDDIYHYQPAGELKRVSLEIKPQTFNPSCQYINSSPFPLVSNVYHKDEWGGLWQKNLDDGTFRYVFHDSKNEYVEFEPQQPQANS